MSLPTLSKEQTQKLKLQNYGTNICFFLYTMTKKMQQGSNRISKKRKKKKKKAPIFFLLAAQVFQLFPLVK